MSNPAVLLLAETKIQGKNVRIEDNLGEAIHIHIGEFRFSLSINEFLKISSEFLEGIDGILRTSNLSLDTFDKNALDWGWLARYSEIEKVEKTTVLLGDLFTIKGVEDCPGMTRIVPVSEAPKLQELNNAENKYIKNNDRLCSIMKKIRKEGYLFDNKLIMINQYNQIYDGDHRAACLMYLYGPKKEIPVIRIYFSTEKTIEEQKEREKIAIQKYNEDKLTKDNEKKQWSEEENILDISFKEFAQSLICQDTDFYVINCAMKNHENELTADKVIIIQQGKMIDLCKKFHISYYGKNYYRYYKFLYSMQRGVNIKLNDCTVMLFDRLCCKSKFENAFIPLDKIIQKYVWDERVYDAEDSLYAAGNMTTLIFRLVNGVFNKSQFDEEDIAYIQGHSEYLQREEMKRLLKPIFFSYTDKFLELIINNDYELAIAEHVKNMDY